MIIRRRPRRRKTDSKKKNKQKNKRNNKNNKKTKTKRQKKGKRQMKKTNKKDWNDSMWQWARRQISFIKRMKGVKGDLHDKDGVKTRKHTALLIWGHNPEK